jgi:hypothetical protein
MRNRCSGKWFSLVWWGSMFVPLYKDFFLLFLLTILTFFTYNLDRYEVNSWWFHVSDYDGWWFIIGPEDNMWRSLVSICDGRCCHHLRNVAQFGVCWGRAFGVTWGIPIASPASWAFDLRCLWIHESYVCYIFVGKRRHRRHPGEGSQWLGTGTLRKDIVRGWKGEASHQRSGEGCHVDACTWQHLIGAPKGNIVM